MVRIEDGKGSGKIAAVTFENRLQVESKSSARDFFISKDDGQSYHVISEDATAVANEETIYIQNTSTTKNLFIDHITLATDTANKFRLKYVTGTAAGGSALTAQNLNKTSSNAADAITRGSGSVTGLTDDGDLVITRVSADDTGEMEFDDKLILGQNDAVAVETEANAAVEITIDFHFE